MWIAPYRFTLRQLQYAVSVAEFRSFRKAAEACHVSQPALSAQIAELEKGLDTLIFERDRKRVLLTLAGEELVFQARRILTAAEDLSAAAQRVGDPLSGTLRVGIIPTISAYLLPEIVPVLRRRYPRLQIVWIEDKTAALAHSLRIGMLEAALVALEADLGELEHAILAEDPFVLALPPAHPLAAVEGPATLEETAGASVLLLDEGHCLREQALGLCSQGQMQELSFRATSLPTLVQMVAGGTGVTLLPRLSVPTENRRGELRLRRFAAPVPFRTLALCWRPRSPLAIALGQVAKTLRTACRALEPRLEAAVDQGQR